MPSVERLLRADEGIRDDTESPGIALSIAVVILTMSNVGSIPARLDG